MVEKIIEVKRLYGTIDNIEESVSRNGNTYYKVYIEGGLFFLWNQKLIDNDWVSKDIVVYYEQNGNFKTIKAIFEPIRIL